MRKFQFILAGLVALLTLFSCKKEKPEDPENPEVVLEAIAFESESLEMALGEARQLFVFMFPTDVTDKEVQYDSESPAIVSISETGKATALKEGKAVITAKCGEKEASCTITVTIPVEKIEFSVPSVSMKVNDELKTSVKITPPNATLAKRIEYEIDQAMDKSPIYVELDGASPNNITITAVKTGQETITAKCGGKVAQLFVYVDAVKVTNVTVSPTSLTLKAGQSRQLAATVEPSNATNKKVSWDSANPDVAAVVDGLLYAYMPGTTQVRAYCGDKSAVCTVTVNPPDGAVDLGLSVCWASCNLGASYNYMPGGYYAWGERFPKSYYAWITYELRQSGNTDETVKFTRYNTLSAYGKVDNKTDFQDYYLDDDAAWYALGGWWRVPSAREFQELIDNCSAEWVVLPSLGQGIKFTSKVPGYTTQSIFLPAWGWMSEDQLTYNQILHYTLGEVGEYMCSSILARDPRYNEILHIVSPDRSVSGNLISTIISSRRDLGHNIRPVWGPSIRSLFED